MWLWCTTQFAPVKLIKIYLNGLSYAIEHTDIFNFADDICPHCRSNDVNKAIANTEHDCTKLVEWFRDNFMTLNASEYHSLFMNYMDELIFA